MMIGLSLLLIALLITVLMMVKLPYVEKNRFSLENPIKLYPAPQGINNFYNFTIETQDKKDHHIEIVISPYPSKHSPMWVDFWVVNETGFGILISFLSYGVIFQPEYPDKYPFTTITAYAKGINITRETKFKLYNLLSNVTYCLVLINFWKDPQNVSVTIEERYIKSYYAPLEPNFTSIIVATVSFTLGTYMVVTSRRKKPRRAKLYTKIKLMIPEVSNRGFILNFSCSSN